MWIVFLLSLLGNGVVVIVLCSARAKVCIVDRVVVVIVLCSARAKVCVYIAMDLYILTYIHMYVFIEFIDSTGLHYIMFSHDSVVLRN